MRMLADYVVRLFGLATPYANVCYAPFCTPDVVGGHPASYVAAGVISFTIRPWLQEVARQGVVEGWVTVLSRHTTTALVINENESRLLDDIRQARMAGDVMQSFMHARVCSHTAPQHLHCAHTFRAWLVAINLYLCFYAGCELVTFEENLV
jgi:hypothetical protein